MQAKVYNFPRQCKTGTTRTKREGVMGITWAGGWGGWARGRGRGGGRQGLRSRIVLSVWKSIPQNLSPLLPTPSPPASAHNWCSLVTCVTWMHRRVVLWDWELMHFQAYVDIIFVYRVVCVDMSTRSSQLNHLNLDTSNHWWINKNAGAPTERDNPGGGMSHSTVINSLGRTRFEAARF